MRCFDPCPYGVPCLQVAWATHKRVGAKVASARAIPTPVERLQAVLRSLRPHVVCCFARLTHVHLPLFNIHVTACDSIAADARGRPVRTTRAHAGQQGRVLSVPVCFGALARCVACGGSGGGGVGGCEVRRLRHSPETTAGLRKDVQPSVGLF